METKNQNNEEWKPIKGYEGLYEISNFGRVRSIEIKGKGIGKGKSRKGGLLSVHLRCKKKKYYCVHLSSNGKNENKAIHFLVMDAFLPNPNPEIYDEINHIDEDPSNNCLSNLEWCDSKYNNRYGTCKQRGLETKKQKGSCNAEKSVQQFTLDGQFVKEYKSISECCRINNYNAACICECCKGRQKTAYGYIWKYAA